MQSSLHVCQAHAGTQSHDRVLRSWLRCGRLALHPGCSLPIYCCAKLMQAITLPDKVLRNQLCCGRLTLHPGYSLTILLPSSCKSSHITKGRGGMSCAVTGLHCTQAAA